MNDPQKWLAVIKVVFPWHFCLLLGVVLVLVSFSPDFFGHKLTIPQHLEDRAFWGGLFFLVLGIGLAWYRKRVEAKANL